MSEMDSGLGSQLSRDQFKMADSRIYHSVAVKSSFETESLPGKLVSSNIAVALRGDNI